MIGRRPFLLGLAGLSSFFSLLAAGRLAVAAFAGGEVEVTADDIAWFRRCRSVWVDCESGAPALIPDGTTLEAYGAAFDAKDSPLVARMQKLVCATFLHAAFGPGAYRFRAALDGHDGFSVTAEHIKLLQHSSWRTSAIDCKRPYGNYTNYVIDMARALGFPVTRNAKGYDEIAPDVDARMEQLHKEMQFVLQAYVERAELAPGRWFLPFDGWEYPVLPRCVPVPAATVEAYKTAMAQIDASGMSPVDQVIPRLDANSLLFDVDRS